MIYPEVWLYTTLALCIGGIDWCGVYEDGKYIGLSLGGFLRFVLFSPCAPHRQRDCGVRNRTPLGVRFEFLSAERSSGFLLLHTAVRTSRPLPFERATPAYYLDSHIACSARPPRGTRKFSPRWRACVRLILEVKYSLPIVSTSIVGFFVFVSWSHVSTPQPTSH